MATAPPPGKPRSNPYGAAHGGDLDISSGDGTAGNDGAILIGLSSAGYSPPTPNPHTCALYVDGSGNLVVKGPSGTVKTIGTP